MRKSATYTLPAASGGDSAGKIERAGLRADGAGHAVPDLRADVEVRCSGDEVDVLAEREHELAGGVELLDPLVVGVGDVDVAGRVRRNALREVELSAQRAVAAGRACRRDRADLAVVAVGVDPEPNRTVPRPVGGLRRHRQRGHQPHHQQRGLDRSDPELALTRGPSAGARRGRPRSIGGWTGVWAVGIGSSSFLGGRADHRNEPTG